MAKRRVRLSAWLRLNRRLTRWRRDSATSTATRTRSVSSPIPAFLGGLLTLVAPFRTAGITKVAGIEARGFVLASAAAVELGVGFIGVRKAGSVLAGEKEELRTTPDWRGVEEVLRLQRHVIVPGDGVLVVDDWAETGAKAVAARALIERCGGRYCGLSLLVNQLPEDVQATLEPVTFIVRAEDVAAE
jgi:adenine phosphoribosyltransferase